VTAGPLIAIAGPTASGKTDLSLKIAQQYNGEIICADSRTVYRGMDIGTAKPTPSQREKIRHYCIDLVEPGERFTAADFKAAAEQATADIRSRHKLPIAVGGTGLYIDSLLYNFSFRKKTNEEGFEDISIAALQAKVDEEGIELNDSDYANRRRLVSALQSSGEIHRRESLGSEVLYIGMQVPAEELRRRIASRVKGMVAQGFLEEVESLGRRYGFESEALTGIGYRAFAKVVKNDIPIEEATKEFVTQDIRFAKRQMTWLKRNPDIKWAKNDEQALALVAKWAQQRL
jgi:tRNA dimethylallyltransferase